MIFSDRDIRQAVREGRISIDPFEPDNVQPASVDLRLDNHFLVFDTVSHHIIDVKRPVDSLMKRVEIDEEQPFILHPGEFALGATFEEVGVGDDVVGRLEGKSSLGRLGIIIHATAGYLDPGNRLKLTLELSNIGRLPVKLYYRMPIAQISFSPLTSACETPYGDKSLGSKYFGAQEPQASQMWKNFDQS
ncbi:deoxycytidine triphosphate deaminase [Parcubacteria bacterium SG8_24]|nr:MAG: deoxycytidine triphosphate deaminase [Parcubacteria bacterium SG8_24]